MYIHIYKNILYVIYQQHRFAKHSHNNQRLFTKDLLARTPPPKPKAEPHPNEGDPAPVTPLPWRIAKRVIQLRYRGWTWDGGKNLGNPPREWTDNYLKTEGQGLLGLVREPDFQLKDVLPFWQDDGWFWHKVHYHQ